VKKAILGLPISSVPDWNYGFSDGWPTSWLDHGFGPIKQVKWLGNHRYSKARVRTFMLGDSPVKINPLISVSNIVWVEDRGNFNFVIVCLEFEATEDIAKHLIKPGNSATKKLFLDSFGIKLDDSLIVNGTCVFNVGARISSARDATLQTSTSASDFFFEVAYGLGIAAITAERLLLEMATDASFRPGPLSSKARKALSLTENWISVPASDSSVILKELQLLRDCLHLDQRMSQVRRSLKHQTSKVNQFLAYSFSIPTFLATALATLKTFAFGFGEVLLALSGIFATFVVAILVREFFIWKRR